MKRMIKSKNLSLYVLIIFLIAGCTKKQLPKLVEAESCIERGLAYLEEGQVDQAIANLNKAIELNPRDDIAYGIRGNAYVRKGQYDKAITDFNNAIKLNPRYAMAYNSRAVCYFYKKRYDNAWNDVRKAQYLGYKINPKFLIDLREASGSETGEMSKDEIIAAFSGKTVEGYNHKKDFTFYRYYDPNGTLYCVSDKKGKREGKWSAKSGKLCEDLGRYKCRIVKKKGDEVFRYTMKLKL